MGDEHSLAAAVKALQEQKAAHERRAARFGIKTVPVNPFKLLEDGALSSKTDAVRLAKLEAGRPEGTFSGVDVFADEAKRAARAARFGKSFDVEAERFKLAGLSDAERKLRAERRARAAKFGHVDELDVNLAKAAAVSLADDAVAAQLAATESAAGGAGASSSSADAAASAAPAAGAAADADVPVVRPDALHMRGCGYLPAHTRDVYAFFADAALVPSHIEWLNGISLNVIFSDPGTARRALELLAEPVPAAPGVAPVWGGWRVALKPLRKLRTDKWAPEGTETTIFLRLATSHDSKERAPGTTGARTHGTWSGTGEFALPGGRRVARSDNRGGKGKRQVTAAGGMAEDDEDEDDDDDDEAEAGAAADGAAAAGSSACEAGTDAGMAADGADAAAAGSAAAGAGDAAAGGAGAAAGGAGAAAGSAAIDEDGASGSGAAAGKPAATTRDGKAFVYAGVRDQSAVLAVSKLHSQLTQAAQSLARGVDAPLLDGRRGRRDEAGAAAAVDDDEGDAAGAGRGGRGAARGRRGGAAAGAGAGAGRQERPGRKGRDGRRRGGAEGDDGAAAGGAGAGAAAGEAADGGAAAAESDVPAVTGGKRSRRRLEEDDGGRDLERHHDDDGADDAGGHDDDGNDAGAGEQHHVAQVTGEGGSARVRGRGRNKAPALAAEPDASDAGVAPAAPAAADLDAAPAPAHDVE